MSPIKAFLSLLFLSLFACHKSSDLENAIIGDNNDSSGVFSASIDGQPWIASTRFATIMNGAITLSGTDGHNNTLGITLSQTVTGAYTMGLKSPNATIYTDSAMYLQAYTTDHSQAGGKVNVTSIDTATHRITGNFTLDLYNDSARRTRHITQGNFKNLPYYSELPAAKSTDTFTVQIDGANWVAKSISAGLVEGEMVVKGSEQDASRFVSISFPQFVGGGWRTGFYPFEIMGAYINGSEVYSTLKPVSTPDGTQGYLSWPGSLEMLEYNPTTRRLRAHFSFQAVTLSGVLSAQLTNGYFSIQY